MKSIVVALLLCCMAPFAHAEKSATFGDVQVHYNAITTDMLQPEVARAYAIERSKTRGLLTVSVLKKNSMGMPVPVAAKLTAYATNLTQQLATIPLREIREGTAVYYLGEFRVAPPDTLKFTLTVDVPGQARHEIVFSQSFYK